ncbi:hypothetical protein QJS10_CPA05g01561 [Acorus calamus]|uniref:Uncharacterized protein n=1 Tax=Acorus calamus TaxID=4465 RepID=A0AAV9EZ43_ACOCL|nr:hypothetical protein QJS10_CPA05g01561 [Acorus calamus]
MMHHTCKYMLNLIGMLGNVSLCCNFLKEKGGSEEDKEDGDEGSESDGEDLEEADEDESDLDLAWKMLDIAREIAEKHEGYTMEKVDILASLAETSMERGLLFSYFWFLESY